MSIMQDKKECYICKKTFLLEKHHCIYGTAKRKLSDEDGLAVWLCHIHHRGTNGVHGKNGLHDMSGNKINLKQEAQKRWQEYYNKTTEDWIHRYGRNYLP